MYSRETNRIAALLVLSLGSTAFAQDAHSTQVRKAVSCGSLDARVTLPLVHEFCRDSAQHAHEQPDSVYFAELGERTYTIRWMHVPEPVRKRLLAEARSVTQGLFQAPETSDEVVLVGPKVLATTDEYLETHGRTESSEQRTQASTRPGLFGAVVRYCMVDGVEGHYETTRHAVAPGSEIVQLSSLEADNYEWNNPYAHGQADYDPNTFLPEPSDTSIQRFERQVDQYLNSIATACKNAKYEIAAYHMGYLLHATQDLATHAGLTNPEHSFHSYKGRNPDADPARVDNAKKWSIRVGLALDSKFQDCSFKAKSAKTPTDAQLRKLGKLYGRRDGTWWAKIAYTGLGKKYEEKKLTPGAGWFNPSNPLEANKWFEDHVLARINGFVIGQASPASGTR